MTLGGQLQGKIFKNGRKSTVTQWMLKKEFAKLMMEADFLFICEGIFDIENYCRMFTQHAGTKFKPLVTTDETGDQGIM